MERFMKGRLFVTTTYTWDPLTRMELLIRNFGGHKSLLIGSIQLLVAYLKYLGEEYEEEELWDDDSFIPRC